MTKQVASHVAYITSSSHCPAAGAPSVPQKLLDHCNWILQDRSAVWIFIQYNKSIFKKKLERE